MNFIQYLTTIQRTARDIEQSTALNSHEKLALMIAARELAQKVQDTLSVSLTILAEEAHYG
jgi:hypothetical protein